jgi:hypothetical protein
MSCVISDNGIILYTEFNPDVKLKLEFLSDASLETKQDFSIF